MSATIFDAQVLFDIEIEQPLSQVESAALATRFVRPCNSKRAGSP
jgi:hypothetical protein